MSRFRMPMQVCVYVLYRPLCVQRTSVCWWMYVRMYKVLCVLHYGPHSSCAAVGGHRRAQHKQAEASRLPDPSQSVSVV